MTAPSLKRSRVSPKGRVEGRVTGSARARRAKVPA